MTEGDEVPCFAGRKRGSIPAPASRVLVVAGQRSFKVAFRQLPPARFGGKKLSEVAIGRNYSELVGIGRPPSEVSASIRRPARRQEPRGKMFLGVRR